MGEGARRRIGRRRPEQTPAPGGMPGSGRRGSAADRAPHCLDRGLELDVADDDRMDRARGEQGREEVAELLDRDGLHLGACSIGRQRSSSGRMTPPSSRAGPRRRRGEMEVEALDRGAAEAGEQGPGPSADG